MKSQSDEITLNHEGVRLNFYGCFKFVFCLILHIDPLQVLGDATGGQAAQKIKGFGL